MLLHNWRVLRLGGGWLSGDLFEFLTSAMLLPVALAGDERGFLLEHLNAQIRIHSIALNLLYLAMTLWPRREGVCPQTDVEGRCATRSGLTSRSGAQPLRRAPRRQRESPFGTPRVSPHIRNPATLLRPHRHRPKAAATEAKRQRWQEVDDNDQSRQHVIWKEIGQLRPDVACSSPSQTASRLSMPV